MNTSKKSSYGYGLFETMKIVNKRPKHARRHLDRMFASAENLLHMENLDELRKKAGQMLDTDFECNAIKLIISDEGLMLEEKDFNYSSDIYEKGVDHKIVKERRYSENVLLKHKTLNYLDNYLALKQIPVRFFDALFTNEKGQICEGAKSNIFFIKGDSLYTPEIGCGLLPGIIRGHILEHYKVKETFIKAQEITQFEGAFVTNSLIGVAPVKCIVYDEKEIEFSLDNKLMDILKKEYKNG